MVAASWDIPKEDLHTSVENAWHDLKPWKDARFLVTGGTGFLGSWLVSSLLHANQHFDLNLQIVLLTRHPDAVPIAERAQCQVVQGDVCKLPAIGTVDAIIHGAASSSAPYGVGDGEPRTMARTIVDGTRAVLELGALSKAKLLFLSSGAVYGPQMSPVSEDARSAPDPLEPASAYGQAKRLAETLTASATAAGDVSAVVARLFAFVGPRIPLTGQLAAGNFLSDALGNRVIKVRSDGRAIRSYLYTGDLPEWCWAVLSRGAPGTAFNVGSPDKVTIADLAARIDRISSTGLGIEVTESPHDGDAPCYVPSTTRASELLGLAPRIPLDEAIEKSLAWFRRRQL